MANRTNMRRALIKMYKRRYAAWANREPPRWRIISWLKWKSERPYMPKWMCK